MHVPAEVKQRILAHYERLESLYIMLDEQQFIINFTGPQEAFGLDLKFQKKPITELFPILYSETFEHSFNIPFYNITEHLVCDIHFIKNIDESDYLVFVPSTRRHKVEQKKQQVAHEENMARRNLQMLSEDLQQKQKELIAADEQKAFFISVLSHELATPLTSISGYAELLQKNQITADKATPIILKNSNAMRKLIEQTVNYGKNDSSQIKSDRSNFSIQELFDSLLEIHLPAAQEKQLDLIFSGDQKHRMYANLNRIQQIMVNLISNAIKYTEKGQIEVGFFVTDGRSQFSVSDTGIGMSQAFVKDLFKPWSREHKSKAKGNGIGLNICQMLAQQIKANLSLKYTRDTGSCFLLELPNATQQKSPEDTTILLADDDEDILNLLQYYLQSEGYQVKTLSSMNALIETATQLLPDLIITDIHFGQQQMVSLLPALLRNNFSVIAMTAMPSIEKRNQLLTLGFKDVIVKPISQSLLYSSIIHNLKHH